MNERKQTRGEPPATGGPVSTPGRQKLGDPHHPGSAETGRSEAARKAPGSDAGASSISDGQRDPGSADDAGTEPRPDKRLGGASSQGLSGAQGSGGAAERGPSDAPHHGGAPRRGRQP